MSVTAPAPARTDAASPVRPPRPSTARVALMVAEREIVTQVRTKSFIISTSILLGAVLLSIRPEALTTSTRLNCSVVISILSTPFQPSRLEGGLHSV